MKYGLVLPLSGIERAIEQLVEYAHMPGGRQGRGFLEDYIIKWAHYNPWLTLTAMALLTKRLYLSTIN